MGRPKNAKKMQLPWTADATWSATAAAWSTGEVYVGYALAVGNGRLGTDMCYICSTLARGDLRLKLRGLRSRGGALASDHQIVPLCIMGVRQRGLFFAQFVYIVLR